MTKVTYIDHSGFLVETSECAIIFDYYKGDIPLLSRDTQLYVLSSHNHRDHFNPEIFNLRDRYPHITYILSHDIKNQAIEAVRCIAPDESAAFPHFTLKTTDSTDQGVSFLLNMNSGETIFHAGDLNWWTWIGEETEAEAASMESRFKKEVAKLPATPIDLAFLPLDPRQQDRFYWGFHHYMTTLTITHAFPMHFWGNDTVIDRIKTMEESKNYRNNIEELRKSGDSLII